MRRTVIRKRSYLLALFAVLLIWAVTASVGCKKYKTQVSLTQQRALLQAGEYLGNIETDLKKARYCGTGAMLSSLAADLSTQAAGAKTALSSLGAGERTLSNTYKFLSQVGAFTDAMGKQTDAGKQGDGDRETLTRLHGYASALSRRFDYMCDLLNSGYLRFEDVKTVLDETEQNSEQILGYMDMAADAEDSMTDFPKLIYDGPFSDNILSKTSRLLENAEKIPRDEAKKKAAALLKAEEDTVIADGDAGGRIETYRFHYNGAAVAITKQGGYPAFMLSETTAGEAGMAGEEAVSLAAAFLRECGYKQMVSSYYASADGVCTVNFAYKENGVVCYPDLIKVGVSLRDGSIVSMDASDYLMNHTERTPPASGITRAAAEAAVAEGLRILRVREAVIPTGGGYETFAWEIMCEDENGQDVLVYIDKQTGQETEILLLLYADGGTLTK
ncbi:MAG: germination protein YpeB [Clostridia bacterium]|nr:germination protein YpeB [Clostridia bacterium]MBR0538224.1 germination protein YpeB [Clostridia bacterium]